MQNAMIRSTSGAACSSSASRPQTMVGHRAIRVSAAPSGRAAVPRSAAFLRASKPARRQGTVLRSADVTQAEGEGTAAPAAPVDTREIREVTKDDFYPSLEAAGDNIVVVDFYTSWCGPCKAIYPRLLDLQDEMADKGVTFLKLNCNKYNKELGVELGIKVAPTFHLYRNSKKVAEMTGAKVDELIKLINNNQ